MWLIEVLKIKNTENYGEEIFKCFRMGEGKFLDWRSLSINITSERDLFGEYGVKIFLRGLRWGVGRVFICSFTLV